jgi:hypothetical protein
MRLCSVLFCLFIALQRRLDCREEKADVNLLQQFLDSMSPFRPAFYANMTHDDLLEVLLSVKTTEDLGNIGEALFVYFNTLSARSESGVPPLGHHSADPPSTVRLCRAFQEGFPRQNKVAQFYKIFYVLKLVLPDVDRPCPMDEPMDFPPNEYEEWEMLFMAGKLVARNYEELPPAMFKYLYSKLETFDDHDVLDMLNSLFTKKATLSGAYRAQLQSFTARSDAELAASIQELEEAERRRQAKEASSAELPFGGRKKDFAISDWALLRRMFLHFSVPFSECTMVPKFYSPVCSKIHNIVDRVLSDAEMLLFVRLYPNLLLCLYTPRISDGYKGPILGEHAPTMMKLLLSKARSDYINLNTTLYERGPDDDIRITLPFSFLDANIRAFTIYSSWSVAHSLAKDLLFFAKATNFSFLDDIFASGYSRLIETFIFYLIYRSSRPNHPLSMGVEFDQLPHHTQFTVFFVLPNMYYAKWRLSDKLYEWYFRTMDPPVFFELMNSLLEVYRRAPALAAAYVDTLYNCMNYENFGNVHRSHLTPLKRRSLPVLFFTY